MAIIYINTGTDQIVQGPGNAQPVGNYSVKYLTQPNLQVIFLDVDGVTPIQVPNQGALEFIYAIKDLNQFTESTFLVYDDDWTLPSGDDTTYSLSPNFNTTELEAELGGTNTPSIQGMLEISWGIPGQPPSKTFTTGVTIYNAVIQGDEGTPTPATPPYPAPSSLLLLQGLLNGSGISILKAGSTATVSANLAAGANISITPAGSSLVIASTGGASLDLMVAGTSVVFTGPNNYQFNLSLGAGSGKLPASPSVGLRIGIEDSALAAGSNPLTILPNGNLINAGSSSYVAGVVGFKLAAVFCGSSIGWSIK